MWNRNLCRPRFAGLIATVLAAVLAGTSASAVVFTPIGQPTEDSNGTYVRAASNDGRFAFVEAYEYKLGIGPQTGHFRWSPIDGFEGRLEPFYEGRTFTYLTSASRDGTYVHGWSSVLPTATGQNPPSSHVLWENDQHILVDEITGIPTTSVHVMSDDARTFAGRFEPYGDGTTHIGMWSEDLGFRAMEPFGAFSVSGDGSIFFGTIHVPGEGHFNAVWTPQDGTTIIDWEPAGQCTISSTQNLYYVSRSGEAAYSSFKNFLDFPGFVRWTPQRGLHCITGFDPLPQAPESFSHVGVFDTTDDGAIVVGFQYVSRTIDIPVLPYRRAFLWDEANGVRYLDEMLAEAPGVDMTGWSDLGITSISGDGRVLTGHGIHEDADRAFIVHLWFEREDLEIEIGSDLLVRFLLHSIGDPIEVAVFGSEDVDVNEIAIDTLALQHRGAPLLVADERPPVYAPTLRDVDEDGHMDLLVYFSGDDLGDDLFVQEELCMRGLIGDEHFEACAAPAPYFAWCGRGFQWAMIPVVAFAVGERRRKKRARAELTEP